MFVGARYRFPCKDEVRVRWIAALRREDPVTKRPWIPGPAAYVCSEHFRLSDFRTNRGYQLLKPDTVPSIFKFPQQVNNASRMLFLLPILYIKMLGFSLFYSTFHLQN